MEGMDLKHIKIIIERKTERQKLLQATSNIFFLEDAVHPPSYQSLGAS